VTVSPFDSAIWGGLFAAPTALAPFSDAAEIAAMVEVERALARAQGRCGVIPADAAAAIDRGLRAATVAPEALAAGTAAAGVPVPALVTALRAHLPPEAGHWLHWGATSQDIADSGLALRLGRALADFAAELDGLIGALAAASARWADLPMAGRTRSQIAAPTTFGHRVARWAQPLLALQVELEALRPRVARVQFGGAVGINAAVAPHGPAVIAALAEELDLAPSPPWHTDRSGLAALVGWCAQLAASLGKMAGDLILMGRTEIAEAGAGAGGGSSTMPQKANPVAAETILALARLAACLAAPMHLAALQQEERDGAAWSLEWLVLPQGVAAAGACLRLAAGLVASLRPDAARMAAGLAAGGGVAMAEAVSFRLAASLPRPEAETLVKAAAQAAAAGSESFAEALDRLAPAAADWREALDPAASTAAARMAVRATFERSGKP
jgi:3-carboxy-cis,cis-muconate cycloisomerase